MVQLLRRGRRRSRAAIEHERLLSLVNSMADGVIAVDEHLDVVLSNGAALNVLDSNSSLQGKSIQSIFKPFDKNNQPVGVPKLIRGAKTPSSRRDLHLVYSDGSIVDLYLSIAPVHLGFGEKGARGFVLLMRDITREKSLEEERDEFISMVSHELRTPIAVSEGNISNAQFILDKTKDLSTIKQALDAAHEQIIFLASMVNDLATLSRAERGKLTVDITSIDIPALLKAVTGNYTPEANKRHLELHLRIDPGVKALQTSELYVREILQNFMTNALKYTEKGSVTLSATAADNGVTFAVTDTGIGISKSDQEKLFDKFFRSDDYRARKVNGTGLGLYVTVKLARLLHADIDVASNLNEGSTFSITIPNLK
ncbi:MAG TPA: ATP-binding protein [Candidatus Saccharimonadales bacterium]|nr:ATP-binding protein [Candidatus Saccharimonadales bacterium]